MSWIRLFVYFAQVQEPVIVLFCLSLICFACEWHIFTFLIFNIVCFYLHFVNDCTFILCFFFCILLALWTFKRWSLWYFDKIIVLIWSVKLPGPTFLLNILSFWYIFGPRTFLFFNKYVVFIVLYLVDCCRLWRFVYPFTLLLFTFFSNIKWTNRV